MNEQLNYVTNPGIANKIRNTQAVIQDRTRRFGYHGGTPNLTFDPKSSGLTSNPITGGQLLPFYPVANGYTGALDPLMGIRKTLYTTMMPGELAYNVDRKFHLNEDFGFRLLPMLTELDYGLTPQGQPYDEAEGYFQTVHHPIADCPFGLFQYVQLADPEVGEATPVWQPCPTCRLASLKSDDVSLRIARSDLSKDTLVGLREALIESNEATLRHVGRKSTAIQSDIARKMTGSMAGRNTLNTIDHIHLKMMHKTLDKNSQNDFVQQLAEAIQGVRQPQITTEGGMVLTEAQAAEYKQWQINKERMAKAREAKEKKEGSNETDTE